MKYRHRVDIIADILRIAHDGAKKTRIMYIANLSYRLLEKYLTHTVDLGFVQANNEGYEATEKGRMFLQKYTQFSSKYCTLQNEVQNMKFERQILERMCEPVRINVAGRKRRK